MTRLIRRWRIAAASIGAGALLFLPPAPASATDQWFDFVGGGWGHGVGMSQWGAKARADAGQTGAAILAAYYPGAAVQPQPASGLSVRVGRVTTTAIAQAATMVLSRDGVHPIAAVPAGQTVSLRRSGSSVLAVFGAATIDLGGVGYVGITQGVPASISATGHRYRWGRIAVRPVGPTQMDVVIDMTIEQWMYGLAEIPASWPAAALEAQAIAGRTFGAYRQRHPRASTYQADSVAGDGYYVGYDHEVSSSADRWIQAVDRTAGRILLWGGSPIQALYSSSNGGYSEVAEYVFASRLPYLTAAPDPYDDAAGNPNRRWTERYSGRELQAWIRARGHPDVGPVVGVDVLGGRGASGRVDRATVNIRGTLGSTRLTGNELRAAINAGASSDRDLRSTRFFVAGGIPAGDDPVGGLDLVRRGPGGIAVAGWAADPDAPEEKLLVLVSVDGRLAGAGRADGASTAVSGGVAGFDANHGFATVVAAPDGPTRVCVAAVNVGPGTSRLLACQTVVK